ncbi:hypothetical protein [Actinosynnema mirum]|uniref:TetR family transcriptional regulator n=1 Tax=Actinosynnema mirum (strain ATCC 29888 / DSM 43827 / JCM 3225 / NBRC 14064 / NCIMB 13271 / NRRL B-12336 / IMRU 3971 / 101) TaxID=446462 RepID=C6W858_ACTMD|nr:hypothetical protein [Actinosynnema mirum]ACU37079.1 hypothetical protein Amir_3168 [Actinosynnema mirum DSM 43827]
MPGAVPGARRPAGPAAVPGGLFEPHRTALAPDALASDALALVNGLHLTTLIDPERFDRASAARSLLWFARGAITG